MNFRFLLVAGALLATACDKTVPTPPGTLLDKPSFTKLSVSEWSLGAPTSPATKVEKTYRYTSEVGPELRFKISFEHGPSELVGAKPGSAPPPVEAPRSIRIDLVENTRWAVTAKCDDDLKVPLEVNPDGSAAYPKMVWTTCDIVMKRKNGDITVGPHIRVRGDGKLEITAFMDDHVEEVPPSR